MQKKNRNKPILARFRILVTSINKIPFLEAGKSDLVLVRFQIPVISLTKMLGEGERPVKLFLKFREKGAQGFKELF